MASEGERSGVGGGRGGGREKGKGKKGEQLRGGTAGEGGGGGGEPQKLGYNIVAFGFKRINDTIDD